jgi:hypothetical protein
MRYLGTAAFVAALALATSASAAVGPKYRLRDPGAGRGYWRGGVWVGF